ncbi:hypothetical protein GCM10020367_14330 [Streptomyces sannanensis]|uniref:Uncharacterized protein n=1 Tax=Streptomyces sannanensis TaxID=285536 RepID=A0ABP6S7H6_9ACTN
MLHKHRLALFVPLILSFGLSSGAAAGELAARSPMPGSEVTASPAECNNPQTLDEDGRAYCQGYSTGYREGLGCYPKKKPYSAVEGWAHAARAWNKGYLAGYDDGLKKSPCAPLTPTYTTPRIDANSKIVEKSRIIQNRVVEFSKLNTVDYFAQGRQDGEKGGALSAQSWFNAHGCVEDRPQTPPGDYAGQGAEDYNRGFQEGWLAGFNAEYARLCPAG